jgi:hypothetical protein
MYDLFRIYGYEMYTLQEHLSYLLIQIDEAEHSHIRMNPKSTKPKQSFKHKPNKRRMLVRRGN